MVVLGICGGHDANWCVFKDGKLIGAFEKERFSRIRHDVQIPAHLTTHSAKS